jgi:hypothetical protein
MKRRRAGQGIVTLHATSVLIGRFTIESQKLDAEATAWPTYKLLRVNAGSNNEQTVEAPFTGLCAAGKNIICITHPHAAQKNSCVSRQPQKSFYRFG